MPPIFVGTYAESGGPGLQRLGFHAARGWACEGAFPGVRNASFGAYSTRHDLHYLVDEHQAGTVGVFRRSGDDWQEVARVATKGEDPCYIALDADEGMLAVANYGSGTVAVFRLDPATGTPLDDPDVLANAGHGPVRDRQGGPHAHCVRFGPDGTWLFHVDLGTDEILAYRRDPATNRLGERRVAYAAPAGSGPRHLVLHPTLPLAILVSELASTLTVLRVEGGTLTAVHEVSTLPDGFTGDSIAGHLSLDRSGARIYVTNRGHDSVAVFDWADGGVPRLLQHVPSGGESPRAFLLLEKERLFVLANEEGNSVTVFAVLDEGTLAPHHQSIAAPAPAFVFAGQPSPE
jgi:6-phosphogluconolactonase